MKKDMIYQWIDRYLGVGVGVSILVLRLERKSECGNDILETLYGVCDSGVFIEISRAAGASTNLPGVSVFSRAGAKLLLVSHRWPSPIRPIRKRRIISRKDHISEHFLQGRAGPGPPVGRGS